jgi:hypothetical protein
MDQPEYAITLDSTDLRSICRVRGNSYAEVTLTNFNPAALFHQDLKRAAEMAVATSRGVVITVPADHV